MTEPRDRAERAFERALAERSQDAGFLPLDPAELRDAAGAAGEGPRVAAASGVGAASGVPAIGRRRPRWLAPVAAAALLVVGVPVGLSVVQDAGVRPTTASAPQEAGAGAADRADEEAGDVAGVAGAGDPADVAPVPAGGTRAVSFLDVVVDVPAGWGYGVPLGADWCAAGADGRQRRGPTAPFVHANPLDEVTPAILCPGEVPAERQTAHLTWRRAEVGDAPARAEEDGWVRLGRPVGSAYVTVVVPVDQEALGGGILASARVVSTDPLGCAVASPSGRPRAGALADLASASSVVVCEYRGTGPRANLVGSWEWSGDAADALLAAVRDAAPAPAASGLPGCVADADAVTTLLFRVDGGVREARLEVNTCTVPVIDDGVVLRTPTRATCADVLVGPLRIGAFLDGADAATCAP